MTLSPKLLVAERKKINAHPPKDEIRIGCVDHLKAHLKRNKLADILMYPKPHGTAFGLPIGISHMIPKYLAVFMAVFMAAGEAVAVICFEDMPIG